MAKRSAQPVLFVPARIVSGGQTGVDRAGLEAAIALGIDHGGWCPAGRLSEDGSVPSRYQLTEMSAADYPTRTRQNIIDSDATLIVYETRLKGGTLLTQRTCKRLDKPFLLVRLSGDADSLHQEQIVATQQWLAQHKPAALNVAGPRESTSPGIMERATDFLVSVLTQQG
ncbi:putative molybdenum carrier protein [Planctomycetes bacterium K23_9]|uniref:Molybdenum carrier n=1 Tax=Stieleria marina TaxID=1930275 RepID=A0A517NW62_9BACT|nr:Putative molybdenum carrier [Planctomycetes bacterium K23_9]